jgi:hypothetical protein
LIQMACFRNQSRKIEGDLRFPYLKSSPTAEVRSHRLRFRNGP